MLNGFCRVLAATLLWLTEHPRYSWREAWQKLEWYRTTINNQFPKR